MRLSRHSILLLAALLLCLALSSARAAGIQAEVKVSRMFVYAQTSPYGYIGSLPKGTVVTVDSYSEKAALIRWNGYVGLASVRDLQPLSGGESAAQAQRDVITLRETAVYKKPSTSSACVTLPAGTALKLLETRGSYAKVSRNGATGYTLLANLGAPDSAIAQESAQQAETVIQYASVPVYTTQQTRLYRQASTTSGYDTLEKGTALKLLAVKGDCAMVEYNGSVGYTYTVSLTTSSPSPTPAVQTTESTFTGSNEQVIYKFLVNEMGYNKAAACGVLANIWYESEYSPTCGGDHGSSYGIVQWHASRKSSMISWCNAHGYESSSLKGQLYYLEYDLKTNYPTVHSFLKNVSNTAQGAYDAGYHFCYYFEAPSSRSSQSAKRGAYARDTLWNSRT